MKVLITRAEPAATRTATLVEALGHEAIKFPLFEIRDTGKAIPGGEFDGFIFTSGNACAILRERDWQLGAPEKPVFCVGEKTAEAAYNLGFRNVMFEQGGAAKLAPEIASADLPDNSKLLYFTTPDRSFDLKEFLAKYKIEVTNLDIYKAVETSANPQDFYDLWQRETLDVILTYSRRSSDVLAETLKQAGLDKALKATRLIAISEYAIGALDKFDWNEIAWPPVANEEAMLHIFDNKQT